MPSLGRAHKIILLVIERLQRGRQRQEREDQDDRGGGVRDRKDGVGYLRGREKGTMGRVGRGSREEESKRGAGVM